MRRICFALASGVLVLTACTSTEQVGGIEENIQRMAVTSPAFESEGAIPSRYTCDGLDISPQLNVTDIPAATTSMALVVEDPDAPSGTWIHWVEFNAPVHSMIPEAYQAMGIRGSNSWGRLGYGGPCPPSGSHRYFFQVFALDADLDLPEGSTKDELIAAMGDHILAKATLMGTYSR